MQGLVQSAVSAAHWACGNVSPQRRGTLPVYTKTRAFTLTPAAPFRHLGLLAPSMCLTLQPTGVWGLLPLTAQVCMEVKAGVQLWP